MDYIIEKKIVLSYLGYDNQPIDNTLNKTIDDAIALSYEYIKPHNIYGIFDVSLDDCSIFFEDKFNVSSFDLYELLKYSTQAVLAAFTLGNQIEQNIKRYSYININTALVLDCCASAAIESYADNIIYTIKQELIKDNKHLTNRFSCGYGDFSLAHQADIIDALSAKKRIGLYYDESNMLYPKKSMTAVAGITDQHVKHTYYALCDNCAAKNNCKYRKAGKHCAS